MAEHACLILAAGRSSRMGFPKGNLRLSDEMTLMEHHMRCFSQMCDGEIFIVLSSEQLADNTYGKALSLVQDRVSIGVNRRVDKTAMFDSLVIGLRKALKARTWRYIFVLPVDLAPVSYLAWQTLKQNCTSEALVILPECKDGSRRRRGHPVVLERTLCKEIAQCAVKSQRLDQIISELPERNVKTCEVEDRNIALDWNSPEDLPHHVRLEHFNSV